jgi:DNA-binding transcriptional LysR family regulator
MYAAPVLIAQSDMCATVMNGVVHASGRRQSLCVLELPVDVETLPFGLFWHRRNDAHPAQVWLRNCISSLIPFSVTDELSLLIAARSVGSAPGGDLAGATK